jgi:hypothetical protein
MPPRAAPPAVQPPVVRYYGALQPQGSIGEADFKTHEAPSTWDDGGVARDLVHEDVAAFEKDLIETIIRFRDRLVDEQTKYGAYQARDAVAEYITKGYLDMAVIDGHACVVFDSSNDAAQLRVWWRLADLLEAAQKQAHAQQDRQMVSALDAAVRGVLASGGIEMPGERIKRDLEAQRVLQGQTRPAASARTMSRRNG